MLGSAYFILLQYIFFYQKSVGFLTKTLNILLWLYNTPISIHILPTHLIPRGHGRTVAT